MEDLRSIFPPAMITPEGNIIVSDSISVEQLLASVPTEQLEAAKKRLREFSREYRLLHPDGATPASENQNPEKPV